MTDAVAGLVDGELARPHGVERRWVAGSLEVGAVVASGLTAGFSDWKNASMIDLLISVTIGYIIGSIFDHLQLYRFVQ